jgi:hypothetical protein
MPGWIKPGIPGPEIMPGNMERSLCMGRPPFLLRTDIDQDRRTGSDQCISLTSSDNRVRAMGSPRNPQVIIPPSRKPSMRSNPTRLSWSTASSTERSSSNNQGYFPVGREDPACLRGKVAPGKNIPCSRNMNTGESRIVPCVKEYCIALPDPIEKWFRPDRHRFPEAVHQCRTGLFTLGTAGEMIRGGRHICCECPDKLIAVPDTEGIIVFLLVSDCTGPLCSHRPPAEGSHSVGGIDLALAGERHDLFMQVVIEAGCKLFRSPREQVRPPYIANKEGVAGEEGNGGLSPGRIGGIITDMFGRMPGSLNNREPDIPELDLIPFSERRMGVCAACGSGRKDLCTGGFSQVEVA